MRLPRVRFTVRRMMVAVAIASLSLGAAAGVLRLSRLQTAYRERAALHAGEMSNLSAQDTRIYRARERLAAEGVPDPGGYLGLGTRLPAPRERIEELNDRRNGVLFRWEWHKKMRAKYERAAERPWLALEPDPPEPE
jgi:hypothetical protein